MLTGLRAEEAATATTVAINNVTATAVQLENITTATAQAVATSSAATLAVADLDDCTGKIVEDLGDILRITRMEPDLDAPVVGAIRAGSEVAILSQVENADGVWYEINQAGRRLGFAPAEYIIIECQ